MYTHLRIGIVLKQHGSTNKLGHQQIQPDTLNVPMLACSNKGCHFHGFIVTVMTEVRLETLYVNQIFPFQSGKRCTRVTKQFDKIIIQVDRVKYSNQQFIFYLRQFWSPHFCKPIARVYNCYKLLPIVIYYYLYCTAFTEGKTGVSWRPFNSFRLTMAPTRSWIPLLLAGLLTNIYVNPIFLYLEGQVASSNIHDFFLKLASLG